MNSNKNCKIISHRGLCKTKISGFRKGENTIESFELGIKKLEKLGYSKAIEFDIRLTKDNIPVVIHDSTIDRTTNGCGRVRDYSLIEIQNFDAGYGRKIPSLSEVLDYFKNENITFNIELKEKNITNIIEQIIYKYNTQKKVIISAFDEDDVDEPTEYKKYCSCWSDLFSIQQKFPIALPITNKKLKKMGVLNYIEIAKNNKAYAIHPEATSVDEKLVKLAHDAGLKVNVWTINDAKIYDRFSKYGVDGVFCDNPSFLIGE